MGRQSERRGSRQSIGETEREKRDFPFWPKVYADCQSLCFPSISIPPLIIPCACFTQLSVELRAAAVPMSHAVTLSDSSGGCKRDKRSAWQGLHGIGPKGKWNLEKRMKMRQVNERSRSPFSPTLTLSVSVRDANDEIDSIPVLDSTFESSPSALFSWQHLGSVSALTALRYRPGSRGCLRDVDDDDHRDGCNDIFCASLRSCTLFSFLVSPFSLSQS